jgi:hypothetical protein
MDLLEDAKFMWHSFIHRFVLHSPTHLSMCWTCFHAQYSCEKCTNLWMNELQMIFIINSSHVKFSIRQCHHAWHLHVKLITINVYEMMHCSSHHTLTMPLWMKFVRPHMRKEGAWGIIYQSFQGVLGNWLKIRCDKRMKHIVMV